MQQPYEILFFKVWHNKYLRCYILNSIKSIKDVNVFSNIESRQDYNSIVSLDWMLKNNQYEMIIDKIKSGRYVHISNKSIKTLITNCNRYDIYELLLKYRRNDMERKDLIEESVKLNSVFSLKSFIQLYGGVNSVANTIKNNGTGEYTSLMDIALSFSSLDVANYLLLQPGLNWYTESTLLENALSYKLGYYKDYVYTYDKKNKEVNIETYLSLHKQSAIIRNQYQEFKSCLKDIKQSQQTTTTNNNTTSIIYNSLKYSINKESFGKHSKIPSVSSITKEFESKTENILEFIENELHQPLGELIKNCKNRNIIDRLFIYKEIDRELMVDLILNHGLYDMDEFGLKNVNPLSLSRSLNFNGQHLIVELKYLILLHSLSISNSTFKSTIQLLKSKNDYINDNELLDSYLNIIFNIPNSKEQSIPNYNNFANYHFIQGDYESILKNYQQLDENTIYNLWILIMFNFSIKGLEFYIQLKQVLENAINDSITTVVTSQNLPSNGLTYNRIVETIKRLELNEDNPQQTIVPYEQTESFFQACVQNHSGEFQIPWVYLFKVLFENYPIHYLESLLLKFPQFISQFNTLISNDESLVILPFKVDQFGEFQFDKIDLGLNHYQNNPDLHWFSLFVKYPPERIYKFNTLQKVKLVNYLVEQKKEFLVLPNSNTQILSQLLKIVLFNDCGCVYKNNDRGSNDAISILESFEMYSLLNKFEINSILKLKSSESILENQTLESYLFNTSLVNSIFGTERNKIKILSIVNENDDGSIGSIKQLSRMKTDSINDKIEYIKFIYSNGLLLSFGCSLSLLLAENLVSEINNKCGIITIKYEEEMVQLIKLMYESSKISDYTFQLLYNLSLKNGLNRLFNQLMKLQSTIPATINKINNDPMDIEIEYNQIRNQIQLDYSNKLINSSNEISSLFSLFFNGNFKELLNVFENINSNNSNGNNNGGNGIEYDDNSQYYLQLFLKLSFKYCDFKIWLSIYQNILKETELEVLLYLSIKFGRLDILVYLIETYKIERDQFLLILRQTIRKGYYPIVKYLLNNYSKLIQPTSSISIKLDDPRINQLFVVALLHGRINVADLIVSTLGEPKNGFILGFDWLLDNGYANVLEYIVKNDHIRISNKNGIWWYIIKGIFTGSSGKHSGYQYIVELIKDTHRKTISNQYHHYKNRIINFKDSY